MRVHAIVRPRYRRTYVTLTHDSLRVCFSLYHREFSRFREYLKSKGFRLSLVLGIERHSFSVEPPDELLEACERLAMYLTPRLPSFVLLQQLGHVVRTMMERMSVIVKDRYFFEKSLATSFLYAVTSGAYITQVGGLLEKCVSHVRTIRESVEVAERVLKRGLEVGGCVLIPVGFSIPVTDTSDIDMPRGVPYVSTYGSFLVVSRVTVVPTFKKTNVINRVLSSLKRSIATRFLRELPHVFSTILSIKRSEEEKGRLTLWTPDDLTAAQVLTSLYVALPEKRDAPTTHRFLKTILTNPPDMSEILGKLPQLRSREQLYTLATGDFSLLI